MKYKLSRFNIYFPADSEKADGAYIFNTFTRSLAKLPEPIHETELSGLKEEDIRTLLSLGIIVDEAMDEIEAMNTGMDLKKYVQKRLMLTIIPTNACNFRCIYCYQPEKTAVMSEVTVERILKWLERNLRYYDELNLGWFGGEPLLCPDIMLKLLSRIRELCKKNGVAMVSSITTNGYLLNIDLFQQLLLNGLLYYQITVDGDETTHNAQRPHKTNGDSYIDERGIMQLEASKELKWLAHDKITEKCASCVYLPMCYTNRCHYNVKVNGSLSCLEYKNLVLPQIERMIEKRKYHAVGSFE